MADFMLCGVHLSNFLKTVEMYSNKYKTGHHESYQA